MSKNSSLRITVTPVRNRSPKKAAPKTSDRKRKAQVYADELLNALQADEIAYLSEPDLFVGVLARAIQDLNKVE